MQVTVNLPDEMARQMGETPAAIARSVIADVAVERYRAGLLSHRQVGELLGLDYWQTESFFRERAVPLSYSASDLEADSVALDRILGGS
jgi:predicted HTH domain antitoxin